MGGEHSSYASIAQRHLSVCGRHPPHVLPDWPQEWVPSSLCINIIIFFINNIIIISNSSNNNTILLWRNKYKQPQGNWSVLVEDSWICREPGERKTHREIHQPRTWADVAIQPSHDVGPADMRCASSINHWAGLDQFTSPTTTTTTTTTTTGLLQQCTARSDRGESANEHRVQHSNEQRDHSLAREQPLHHGNQFYEPL